MQSHKLLIREHVDKRETVTMECCEEVMCDALNSAINSHLRVT